MESRFLQQLTDLQKLNEFIESEVSKRTKLSAELPYRSECINELAESLAAAQGKFEPIPYNRTTATWNDEYSDLDIVMKYIRPLLSENKLAFVQWCEMVSGGGVVLHTELLHSSGQWIESRIKVSPARNDIRTFDSAMADCKRSQAIALLGATLEGDPKDDCGQLASEGAAIELASGADTKATRSRASVGNSITEEELLQLEDELSGHSDLAGELKEKYQICSLSDLPRSKFAFAITQIRKFLQYRSGDTRELR